MTCQFVVPVCCWSLEFACCSSSLSGMISNLHPCLVRDQIQLGVFGRGYAPAQNLEICMKWLVVQEWCLWWYSKSKSPGQSTAVLVSIHPRTHPWPLNPTQPHFVRKLAWTLQIMKVFHICQKSKRKISIGLKVRKSGTNCPWSLFSTLINVFRWFEMGCTIWAKSVQAKSKHL